MDFSEFLKDIRTKAGYTQQDIAAILKTDRSTYAYYESGKTEPNIRSLRRLANLYGITLDELINCELNEETKLIAASGQISEDSISTLRRLSPEEKQLVLLYRACGNKEELLETVRAFEEKASK